MFLFEVCCTGILAGFLTIFLNYCMGKPGSEFSPYEIFSSYTVWLSIKRLQNVGLYNDYIKQYNDNLRRIDSKHEVIQLKNDFKKMLYDAADPFFTWERAVGMCPVCFGFWVSLIVGTGWIILNNLGNLGINIIYLLIIIVISHIVIRLLNKIL